MDSSLSSLCIFYNQAVFYRRNIQEKQFILDTINKKIVEREKECKRIEKTIVDLNNQPKDSIAKLRQERLKLADLYVKQLLVNQKEEEDTLPQIINDQSSEMETHHHSPFSSSASYSSSPSSNEEQQHYEIETSISISSSSSKDTILESPFRKSKQDMLSYNPTEHQHVDWMVGNHGSKAGDEFAKVIYEQKLIETVENIVDSAIEEHNNEHHTGHHSGHDHYTFSHNNGSHPSNYTENYEVHYYTEQNGTRGNYQYTQENQHIRSTDNRSPNSHIYEDNEACLDTPIPVTRKVSKDLEMDAIVENENEAHHVPPPLPPLLTRISYSDMYSSQPQHEEKHYEEKYEEYNREQSIPEIVLSTPPNESPASDDDEDGGEFIHKEIEPEANTSDTFESTITVDYPIMSKDEAGKLNEVTLDATIILSRKSMVEETVPLEHWATVHSEAFMEIRPKKPERVYVEPEPEPEVHYVHEPEPESESEPEPEPEPEDESESESEVEPEPQRSPSPQPQRIPSPRYQPQRVFNIYEDLESEELDSKGNRVVKGNGYEYFKRIERHEVKEEGISDASSVRSSTDHGWQTNTPAASASPSDMRTSSPREKFEKFPFRHKELDIGMDNQFRYAKGRYSSSIYTPQPKSADSTHSSSFAYPDSNKSPIRTPSPTRDVPDYRDVQQKDNYQSSYDSNKHIHRSKVADSTAHYDDHPIEQSGNYQSSYDSNKYIQRTKYVDSPAYTPMSPEEEPRILSPSQRTSSQYSESSYEVHRSTKSSEAIECKPVHSKIFTIPQTHQGDQVNIDDWHRYSQEEEERRQESTPMVKQEKSHSIHRSYAPQNKTMLFDEHVNVDEKNELFKAKAFKAEREKITSSNRFDESHERVEVANVQRPSVNDSSIHRTHEHEHVDHQYEQDDAPPAPVAAPRSGKKYVVDAKNEKAPAWQVNRQPFRPKEEQQEYEVNTLKHENHHPARHQVVEHSPEQHPVVIEKQEHLKSSTTIYSSMKPHPNLRVKVTNDNNKVHQAVTEAAENKFINARIPHSPMITPPSTPTLAEPDETNVPAPKIARGIFKNLERSITEEVRREQQQQQNFSSSQREYDALEAKRRLAEESLQHPGRRPKGGQSLFGGASSGGSGGQGHSLVDNNSNSSEETSSSSQTRAAATKYNIDQTPSPQKRSVTFASEHQEHLYEVYQETSTKIIKKSEFSETDTFSSSHDQDFATQLENYSPQLPHQQHHLLSGFTEAGDQIQSDIFDSTANTDHHHHHHHHHNQGHHHHSSPKRHHHFEEEQNIEEDFRQSIVFKSVKEPSKRRQELLENTENNSQTNYTQSSSQQDYQRHQRPSPRREPDSIERKFNFKFVQPPIIQSFNQYSIMPELEDGIIDNGATTLNSKESDVIRNWDPTELVNALYSIDYEPRLEQKRSKFRNMEGHLEIPNEDITLPELESEWKKVYFRTKDSRLQWFATKYADEHPIGDMLLSDADIIPNRDDFTITIVPKKEIVVPKITVKVPSNLFEKWRQAFLSHRDSTELDGYVQPVLPVLPHLTENIVIIELGSCSIRAGILTHRPSLPQSFFPAIGCVTESSEIYVGNEALKPEIRHNGTLQQPIDSVDLSVERYQLNKPVLNACLKKIINDLEIVPSKFTVLLSISQNIPSLFISELLKILLNENNFKAASIARQPSLILYSYDVTTGVVVDIGERLNIVPVIDEYIVENAIVSLPFGARQIRDSLRENLKQRNNGLYAYQSPIEHTLLRYAVEQASYVSTDFDEEDAKSGDKEVDMSAFKLAPNMESKFTIDQSRFHATEGLFKPKKWNLEVKGLHHLIHNAILLSPIDSRRTLYRNIYLCGGTSLLIGMAERIENELSKLVPGNIHVQVHMSPWRYHAAYLGAQVIASGKLFSKCCATKENLSDYLKQLESSAYANGN